MHHQLGGSTEDDMNKMSVIGHISHLSFRKKDGIQSFGNFRNRECTEHLPPANILGFFGGNKNYSRHERILQGLHRNW